MREPLDPLIYLEKRERERSLCVYSNVFLPVTFDATLKTRERYEKPEKKLGCELGRRCRNSRGPLVSTLAQLKLWQERWFLLWR